MKMIHNLFLIILLFGISSFADVSDKQKRVVRVGYFDQHHFIEKKLDGSFEGYGVGYLDEICKYANWEIEYVFASWSLQLEMLEKGELDLVPFAQYTKECAQKFNYTRQPMGVVQGLLSVRDDNESIYYNEFDAMDGKTVAIVEGNHNTFFLRQFADLHGFKLKPVKYKFHQNAVRALLKGEVDLLASEQVLGRDSIRVVAHFGSDPNYFLLNKKDTSLLRELNSYMNEIYSREGTFRANLYKKYYGDLFTNAKPVFTRKEKEYIEKAGVIEAMLIIDSQPGSYINEKGEFSGIVVDVMNMITELTGLKFKFHFNEVGEKPLAHLRKHENGILAGVLSINPAFKTDDLIMSNDFYESYASLVKNAKNEDEIDYLHKRYKVGIPPMFQAMHLYVSKHYPNLQIDTSHLTISDNLEALENGEIDLFLYDLNMILHYWGNPRIKDTRIVTTSFVKEPQCIVALNNEKNRVLMGIINKAMAAIPKEKIMESERYHISRNYYKPTYMDNLYRLRFPIISTFLFIVLSFIILSIHFRRAKRQAEVIEKTNEKLEKAVMQAQKASQAKSDFLSSMSHDIRTPMNAIMGMTTLVKQEISKNSKAMEYMNKISSSSHILLQLLNNILDSTALERGKMKMAHVPFDFLKEVESLKNIFELQCAKKNVKLIFDFKEMNHTKFLGDPLRFNQIFLNLLSNAYKFTPEHGAISFIAKETSCENNVAKIQFEVKDSGCGISEDLENRLFDPFEQLDATTAHKFGGSGLGLNIVKKLVELNGGEILYESKLGEGTTFIVNMSLDVDFSESKIQEDTKESFDFSGKKILVADDDDFNREVIEGLLEMVHVECVCVDNGKKVVDIFENSEEKEFDAILMDVHMPIMGGYEAAKIIRESLHKNAKKIPIFALTADAFPEDIEKAKDCGMTGHISKPIYQDILYKSLKKAFDNYCKGGGAGIFKFIISGM